MLRRRDVVLQDRQGQQVLSTSILAFDDCEGLLVLEGQARVYFAGEASPTLRSEQFSIGDRIRASNGGSPWPALFEAIRTLFQGNVTSRVGLSRGIDDNALRSLPFGRLLPVQGSLIADISDVLPELTRFQINRAQGARATVFATARTAMLEIPARIIPPGATYVWRATIADQTLERPFAIVSDAEGQAVLSSQPRLPSTQIEQLEWVLELQRRGFEFDALRALRAVSGAARLR